MSLNAGGAVESTHDVETRAVTVQNDQTQHDLDKALLKRLKLGLDTIPRHKPTLPGLPHALDVEGMAKAAKFRIVYGCGRFHVAPKARHVSICIPPHFSDVDSNVAVVREIARAGICTSAGDALDNVLKDAASKDRPDIIAAGLMMRSDEFEEWAKRTDDDEKLCYIFGVTPSLVRARKKLQNVA